MKAISLTQPWASLVAIGAKSLETRSWSTSYRGPLAIHASKGFPKDCRELCDDAPFFLPLDNAFGHKALYRGQIAASLPLGAIVAVCELTGCFATPSAGVPWRQYRTLRLPPDEPERSFGNYEPGRYAWRFENVRRLPEPIACRGSLGLWDVPPDVAAKLEGVLSR